MFSKHKWSLLGVIVVTGVALGALGGPHSAAQADNSCPLQTTTDWNYCYDGTSGGPVSPSALDGKHALRVEVYPNQETAGNIPGNNQEQEVWRNNVGLGGACAGGGFQLETGLSRTYSGYYGVSGTVLVHP